MFRSGGRRRAGFFPAARLARVRRLGLAPEKTPLALVRELHGDLLGEWLPLALADLCAALLLLGGNRTDRTEVLGSWGFPVPKKDTATETDRALAQLFNQGA